MSENLVALNSDGSYPTEPISVTQQGKFPKVGVTPGHRLQVDAAVVNTAIASQTLATVTAATKTVTTAGTAVALAATSTKVDAVVVVPLRTNTGRVFVGTDATGTNQHLEAPFSIVAPDGKYIDLSALYLNSTVNGEGVYYYGLS